MTVNHGPSSEHEGLANSGLYAWNRIELARYYETHEAPNTNRESWKQQLVLANESRVRSHCLIPLPARPKSIQTGMDIRDARHAKLVNLDSATGSTIHRRIASQLESLANKRAIVTLGSELFPKHLLESGVPNPGYAAGQEDETAYLAALETIIVNAANLSSVLRALTKDPAKMPVWDRRAQGYHRLPSSQWGQLLSDEQTLSRVSKEVEEFGLNLELRIDELQDAYKEHLPEDSKPDGRSWIEDVRALASLLGDIRTFWDLIEDLYIPFAVLEHPIPPARSDGRPNKAVVTLQAGPHRTPAEAGLGATWLGVKALARNVRDFAEASVLGRYRLRGRFALVEHAQSSHFRLECPDGASLSYHRYLGLRPTPVISTNVPSNIFTDDNFSCGSNSSVKRLWRLPGIFWGQRNIGGGRWEIRRTNAYTFFRSKHCVRNYARWIRGQVYWNPKSRQFELDKTADLLDLTPVFLDVIAFARENRTSAALSLMLASFVALAGLIYAGLMTPSASNAVVTAASATMVATVLHVHRVDLVRAPVTARIAILYVLVILAIALSGPI